jgi:hypothetical protein
MDDITKKYEFQLLLQDAAKYRMIRDIIEDDHDACHNGASRRSGLRQIGRAVDLA